MASQQQGQLQHHQQQQNGQVASSSNGGQQQNGESRDNDSQDPQFQKLQKAAQLLSSRANADARIEQASELSEVLNC